MIVYVAMIDDTHSDTEPEIFTDRDAAIRFALDSAKEYAIDPSYIEQEAIEGWEFYARYSPESSVWVVAKELHLPESG